MNYPRDLNPESRDPKPYTLSPGGIMKKSLSLFVIVLLSSMFIFSLSYADFANWAGPQLEYISNTFPLLWNKPKTEVLRIMSIFPDFVCTDYTDQLACTSKFNTHDSNDIYINFFMDDYEEHHDNLWKVAVTADVQSAEQMQSLFNVLYIEGMKPFHNEEDEFWFEGVQPLYFDREDTSMVAWFQPYKPNNGAFFLAEYYNGYMR